MLSFIKNIGPVEIIILIFIVILLFGSKIAVKLGKSAGQSLKEIKNVKKEFTGAVEDVKKEVAE